MPEPIIQYIEVPVVKQVIQITNTIDFNAAVEAALDAKNKNDITRYNAIIRVCFDFLDTNRSNYIEINEINIMFKEVHLNYVKQLDNYWDTHSEEDKVKKVA